jgi:hypothetical protein
LLFAFEIYAFRLLLFSVGLFVEEPAFRRLGPVAMFAVIITGIIREQST